MCVYILLYFQYFVYCTIATGFPSNSLSLALPLSLHLFRSIATILLILYFDLQWFRVDKKELSSNNNRNETSTYNDFQCNYLNTVVIVYDSFMLFMILLVAG